ncbi:hypothetical protein ACFCW4_29650 [Streptomyces virginiae]|uniref:hypothetical protein n=1 Tax=Streptomyces virginiae TaxID=1961 RepID=UPI0035E25B89
MTAAQIPGGLAPVRPRRNQRRRLPLMVCRCLRGVSRSIRGISSMSCLYGSSAVGRGGSCFLGPGRTESTAFLTLRHDTLYLRSIFRVFVLAWWSRQIAAYSSTFDICGMARTLHQEHPDAALAKALVTSKLMSQRVNKANGQTLRITRLW